MKKLVLILLTACAVDPDLEAEEYASTGEDSLLLGPWSTPVRIAELSVTGTLDMAPTIRGDGLELFFVSNRNGGYQLFTSQRATIDDPWSTPAVVTAFPATFQNITTPELADNGRTMWFSATNGTQVVDIYVTTRECTSAPWTNPVAVTELNTFGYESSPHVSSDGRWMYFTRLTGPAGTSDIYVATKGASGWEDVRPLARFNTDGTYPSRDDGVTTNADRTEAYLHSDRDGLITMYRSTRAPGEPWSTPTIVAELLAGSHADMTPDGHYMILQKGSSDSDLYYSTR